MEIQRTRYLGDIRAVTGKPIVKVLTGMRRVGKSTLLKQIQAQLRIEGIPQAQIISINFEYMEHDTLRDHRMLDEYLKTKMTGNATYYVFLDEVQEVQGFERVVNSLNAKGTAELFITGSNSTLLSGELATYLTGRYYAIEVLPLSFKEMFPQISGSTREEKFSAFLRTGGLPGTLLFNEPTIVRNYLMDIFQSILLRDIVQRFSIRNVDLLKRFMRYVFANTSQLCSASSITRYLKHEGRSLSRETIYQYLDAAKQTYLIHGVPRFDIKGKQLLKTQEKFFVNDPGLRGIFFDNELDIGQMLENVVYLELRRQRYEVCTGKLDEKEIDFIATRGSEKLYVQVSYLLADPATVGREFSPLEAVNDNFPKLVLSLDPVNRSRNGIKHQHIIDFLLT
jgi:predicted AAA+ superfamily ATPase